MAHERREGQFQLVSGLKPQGDQPQAIEKLESGINAGKKYQVLLGVTGSGKTFTMANVIARVNKPTLVIAPNKTLAAQLYNELHLVHLGSDITITTILTTTTDSWYCSLHGPPSKSICVRTALSRHRARQPTTKDFSLG